MNLIIFSSSVGVDFEFGCSYIFFLLDRDMCGGLNFTTATMNGTRIISLVVMYCKQSKACSLMHLHAEMKSFCGLTAEQNHNSPSPRIQRLNTASVFSPIFVTIIVTKSQFKSLKFYFHAFKKN